MKDINKVKSILKAINILECFFDDNDPSFREICQKTNLSNGTAYRILETLITKKYISKNIKDGKYAIGNALFILSK